MQDTVTYTDDPSDVIEIDEPTANDLVGVAEIADRLTLRASEKASQMAGKPVRVEITRSNVTTWINRRETQKNLFPDPVRKLAMGGLYSWVKVAQWWDKGLGRA